MAGLGETIGALALRKRVLARGPHAAGQSILSRIADFGPNPGDLDMLAYTPAGLPAGRPLVAVLHGCTQTAEGYADGAGWIALAQRRGFALVCPQQKAANNPNRCFNWFEPGDIRRGAGEAASIHAMVQAAIERFACDPTRIYVTGLSAGGAMASVLLATYPEAFAGGGIVAGLPYGVAQGMSQAFSAMFQPAALSRDDLAGLVRSASHHAGPWPRISVWHGSADTTVKPSNADAIVQQWLGVHELERAPDPGAVSGPVRRETWSRDGVVFLERRIITGLGHGAPLNTAGPDGAGRAGPFLLEAGVSSSAQMLDFWEIEAEPGSRRVSAPSTGMEHHLPEPAMTVEWRTVHEAMTSSKEDDVGAVINKALRAAGLMK